MTDELKECPFCPDGGKPGLAYRAVKCYQCGVRVDGDTDMDATEKWNTRYKRTCKPYQTSDGWTCPVCNWSGLTWGVQKCCSGCGTQLDWR